ncbi:MAG: prepilin-type N-terminal cleavage/methylation domain-containing protein [Nitrospiraceae bacterium]|nr:MAG: prepilin-type N-terminal cleavage/methylation domain-containing protein [Nitrospiraceae bacterium]
MNQNSKFKIQDSKFDSPTNFKSQLSTFNSRKAGGFTLIELIIVMLIASLALGLSVAVFTNALPSARLDATAKKITATIRHARSLAKVHGETETVVIDLDSKTFGMEGRHSEAIPSEVSIKVLDPLSGEMSSGKYTLTVDAAGGIDGGTIILWNKKKTVRIDIDPIVGAVAVK